MAVIVYPLDGVKYNAANAATYLCSRISGVLSTEDNFQVQVTGKNQITISPGLAWMQTSKSTGRSFYLNEPVVLTLPESDPLLPRYDSVKLVYSKTLNNGNVIIEKGEASSSPTAPAVTQSEVLYELQIYKIFRPAASVDIIAGNIECTMLDENVCGIMRDPITGIPTRQLQVQVEMLLSDLRAAVDKVTAGNDVMLQTAFNPSGKTGQVAFEADNNSYTLFCSVNEYATDQFTVHGIRSATEEIKFDDLVNTIFNKGKIPTIIVRQIKDIDGNGQIDNGDGRIAMRWCSMLEPEKNLKVEQIFEAPNSFNSSVLHFHQLFGEKMIFKGNYQSLRIMTLEFYRNKITIDIAYD